MKTKTVFLFLIMVAFSFNIKAQIKGKKFELKTEQMGTLVWSFNMSKYVIIAQTGDTLVNGNLKIENDTIVLTNEKGQQACPEGSVGKYKFSILNKELKMVLIEDDCMGRSSFITQPWKQIAE